MRAVFFALLLANVAFFAWAHWIDVPQSAAAPVQEATVPVLALARPAPVRSGTAQRCRTLGPFAQQSSAQSAAAVLRSRGITPRDRTAESTVDDGYWVYIGDLTDPVAQRNTLALLARGGIHDATVVTDPDSAGRVSVGIFSEQARAVRRAEQVRALGLKPVLDLHQRAQRSYWLDMDLRAEQPEPPVSVLQGAAATTEGEPPDRHIAFGDCPVSDKHG